VAIHLKRKDHTTVIHAVSKIKEKQMKDHGFQQELRTIIKSINSST
jgi:chromosomal replication initiation ATPase DnaA